MWGKKGYSSLTNENYKEEDYSGRQAAQRAREEIARRKHFFKIKTINNCILYNINIYII